MKLVRIGDTVLNLEVLAHAHMSDAGAAQAQLVLQFAGRHESKGTLRLTFTGVEAKSLFAYLCRANICEVVAGEGVRLPDQDQRPVPAVFRSTPPLGQGSGKKAWLYLRDRERGYFLAMVNAKGSCSMRKFDAATGRFLGKQRAAGDYREQFAEFIASATELWVRRQPNLAMDCIVQLPTHILNELQEQIQG